LASAVLADATSTCNKDSVGFGVQDELSPSLSKNKASQAVSFDLELDQRSEAVVVEG
jgi:hypothetical protein